MWDDILEFILEIAVELIDFNWNKNKKKEGKHEEIDEDDIKKSLDISIEK